MATSTYESTTKNAAGDWDTARTMFTADQSPQLTQFDRPMVAQAN